MPRFSASRRTRLASTTANAPPLIGGLLISCLAATLSQPAHAQTVVDNGACPTNPGAVVTTPATGGTAISGAADCPAGPSPSARVNDPGGIAIGNDRARPTTTSGNGGSIAIGNGARGGTADPTNGASDAVALGTNANAISSGSIAIGRGAVAGSLLDLTRVNEVAIGNNAAATAQNSTAIGDGSIANGPQATALGSGSSAGTNATATGRSAIAGNSAVAYGVNANAGLRGTALGQGATATAVDSTAIGSFASATFASSVALGRNSITSRGAQTNYAGYGLAAPQTSIGEVSIGTAAGQRQLTGVAAGSAATDAVNVSQLTAIDAQADLLGGGVAAALGGGVTYDGTTGMLTAPAYTVQGATRTSVGGALTALDTQVTSNTTGIATNTADIATNTGDIANLSAGIGNGTIGLTRQTAPGADLTVGAATDGAAVNFTGTGGARRLTGVAAGGVSAASTEAVNGGQLYAGNASLASALGGGTIVNADGTVSAPGYTIQGGTQTNVGGALTALDNQVTTNTAGIATNTGDIATLATGIGNGTVGLVRQASLGAELTIGAATDGAAVNFTGTGGARRLAGVAAGGVSAVSTEAVNGGQLYAGNASLASALGGGAIVNADGTVSAPSYVVQGAARTTVGDALATLDTQVTTNTGDIANLTSAIGSGAVGLVRQAGSAAPVTVAASTGGGSVNFTGTDGSRALTGVANGAVAAGSSEAINGSQLAGTAQSIATALGGGAAVNADGSVSAPAYLIQGGTQASVGGALTALDTQVSANTTAITGLGNQVAGLGDAIDTGAVGLVRQAAPGSVLTVGAATDGATVDFAGTAGDRRLTGIGAGAVSATSTDAINGSQLSATNQQVQNLATLVTGQGNGFTSNNSAGAGAPLASGAEAAAGGNGAVASGQQATAVGNAATAGGARSTAIGYAANASGTSSVALGAGSSDGGESNVVSVGSVGSERRVTNVAMGVNQTDAVNVGQLNTSLGQTLTSANAYTDRRFNELSFDIDHVRRDAEGATAASMALAGIPQSFERGMGMVGMGVGTWQGESAIAVGLSKATDSGFVVKAGATYSSRGQAGANGGVGFAF